MEILYLGEGFSEASRNRLIAWLQQPSANDDLRLGGGLPGWVRPAMAHKPGLVSRKEGTAGGGGRCGVAGME